MSQRSITRMRKPPAASIAEQPNASQIVRVQIFAGAAEAIDRTEIEVSLAMPTSGAAILRAIGQQHPELNSIAVRSRIAVDQRFVSGDDRLDGPLASVAMIPPVSGG